MGTWFRRLANALLLAGAAFAGAGHAAGAAEPARLDYAAAGPHAVEVTLAEWRDAKRGRAVPVKIYAPKGLAGEAPLVLFSHGLGGTRDGGAMWGAHWASHGMVSVHLQHHGSDEAVWMPEKGNSAGIAREMKGAMTAGNLIARVGDVRFALDEIGRRKSAGETPFHAVSLAKIGLAGHSFGAVTTLAASGQRFINARGAEPMLKEPRLKAAIAMSPNARDKKRLDEQFGELRLPLLFLTGTADGSVLGDGTKPEDRTLPFRHAPGPDKVLVVLEGADHMIFNGHGLRRKETPRDAVIQADVRAITLAFWEATLEGDRQARAWLMDGGAKSMLISGDRYETK
jgi:predicted dienelactone hydrolase